MDVFVANEQEVPVNEARSAALVRHTLSSEDLDDNSELSVLFVTSDHIRKLNKRFAGNDYATDVLAFPMMDEDDDTFLLGDVVVCPAVAEKNAHKLGHGVGREIDTLLVHGTLHLLGYDHQGVDDKERMDKRVGEVLSTFHRETSS
jgi:probable rRNA maturation factor